MAAKWYTEGTEVIFACDPSAEAEVIAAAEAAGTAGAKVIGVITDKSALSEAVLTTAMKGYAEAAQWALASYYGGTFAGGQILRLYAAEGAVLLPMETSQFTAFTQESYEAVYERLASGGVALFKDTDAKDIKSIGLMKVKVMLTD